MVIKEVTNFYRRPALLFLFCGLQKKCQVSAMPKLDHEIYFKNFQILMRFFKIQIKCIPKYPIIPATEDRIKQPTK